MVAPEKLARLLEVLRDNLVDLERYREQLPPGRLRHSRDAQHMVLHAMYVTTQACIDAASHVIADRSLPRATTYAAVFHRLAEARVLAPDLAQRLADWASLRNILAHFYPVVDYERVEAALRGDVGDFHAFLAAMDALLRDDEENGSSPA